MSLSKESIKRLRQVKRAILAQPKFYDQDRFPRTVDCGTTCCIAGWAVWVEDPEAYPNRVANIDLLGVWRSAGASALGLERSQVDNLFGFGVLWPQPFG